MARGTGRKVRSFNSKLPGGGGTINKKRVVVKGTIRVHKQHGSVTKGGAFPPGKAGRTGFKAN